MRYGISSPVPGSVDNDMSDTSSVSSDSSFELISPEPASVTENKMTSSFKPSVTFCEMFDMYPVDSDIIARITYDENFEATPDDTVIVLPLAWTSVEQAVCTAKTNGNYIKFDTKELPNTTDQFYQLCYCATVDQSVMGISIPFSFREVHEEELMEFQKEHNKEFWTFRSRFAVLMDIYWNSLVENKKVNLHERIVEEEGDPVVDVLVVQPQTHDETESPNIECPDVEHINTESSSLVEVPESSSLVEVPESSPLVEIPVKVEEAEYDVKKLVTKPCDSLSTRAEKEIPCVDLTTSSQDVNTAAGFSEVPKDISKYIGSGEKCRDKPSPKKDDNLEILLKDLRVKEEWHEQYITLQNRFALVQRENIAVKEREQAIVMKLVNMKNEKDNLAESFNQYKSETEQRMKQSAKEYAKLSLKLKKYKNRLNYFPAAKPTMGMNK